MGKPRKVHRSTHEGIGTGAACGAWSFRADIGRPGPNDSIRVPDDVFRHLPASAQCQRCLKDWWPIGHGTRTAPDWLIVTMECVTAELAKLGDAMRAGEHRCYFSFNTERWRCACGAVSWCDVDRMYNQPGAWWPAVLPTGGSVTWMHVPGVPDDVYAERDRMIRNAHRQYGTAWP